MIKELVIVENVIYPGISYIHLPYLPRTLKDEWHSNSVFFSTIKIRFAANLGKKTVQNQHNLVDSKVGFEFTRLWVL
jgi:hypothetical protein